MSLTRERLEEAEGEAYAQGHSEGFQEGKAAAIAAVKKYIEQNPWPYTFGTRGFEVIEVEALLDFIHDTTP